LLATLVGSCPGEPGVGRGTCPSSSEGDAAGLAQLRMTLGHQKARAEPVAPVLPCPSPDIAAHNPMPDFHIDLDAAPRSRWDAVATELKDAYASVKHILDGTLQGMAEVALAGGVDVMGLLNDSVGRAENLVGTEYYEEMQGLAAALGVPFENIWAFTLIYSISGGCTSVVGNDMEGDTVVHGRLLDYRMAIQPIQLHAVFTKGGSTVFECVTFVGFMGCVTGMVPGGYSISLNQKDTTRNPNDAAAAATNYLRALAGSVEPSIFIRNLLMEEASWGQPMLAKVASTPLTRACYLTVAGVGKDEGVVFCRTAGGVDESRWMDTSLASQMLPGLDLNVNPDFNGKPFVFITNDNGDYRRGFGEGDDRGACAWNKLNEYDSFNISDMWDVILNPCQLQSHTILATVMSPKDGSSDPVSMCPDPQLSASLR